MFWLLLLTVGVIIGLYYLYPWIEKCMRDKTTEGWTNYTAPYYDYKSTGADPLIYYARPIYRKPYMYPFTFYKSYPYPHMSYYELL
jgi:hypothetical protein